MTNTGVVITVSSLVAIVLLRLSPAWSFIQFAMENARRSILGKEE
jgi:hypothetical protein